jgi:hypothetical protein
MNRMIETTLRAIGPGFRTVLLWTAIGLVIEATARNEASAQNSAVEPATAPISKSDVLEWVDQLDAIKASDRSAAEKLLIEAGLQTLEFLPASRPEFSIEATERLSRVKAALMSLKAKSQSKTLRIQLGDVETLGEALEAISRASRIEFEHSANESLAIQSSSAPLSFWHAVDLVLDQANLDINHYGGDRETLQLVTRKEGRQSRVNSAAYSGVYRIEPTSVSARRVFNQPEQSGLNLSMEITWQPGLTPIGLTIPIAQLSGRLDDGQPLKPQTSEQMIDIAANSELAFSEFYLPLELPVDSPGRIESLRGTIESLLPGKRHRFELSLIDVGAEQTVDAMKVKLDRVQRNGPLYEVRFLVELDGADRALESHRQWIFQNPVYVQDAEGNRIENLGYELFRQTDSSVGMGYLFEIDDLESAKLVYESPTSVVRNKVDFVLHDIPLP